MDSDKLKPTRWRLIEVQMSVDLSLILWTTTCCCNESSISSACVTQHSSGSVHICQAGHSVHVVYSDVMSFIVYVMCSVPRRSVLGPLFFILYMADLVDWVAKYGLSLHAYADDTQLYLHFNRTEIASSVDQLERTDTGCPLTD